MNDTSTLEGAEFRCNLVNYTSGCASDCMPDTAVVLNSPKWMWKFR